MNHFHGPGLSKMVLVTILVHVAVILGTSIPYLLRTVVGEDSAALSKEERVEKALEEANASLQKIADTHGLSPLDIRGQWSGKPAAAPKATTESRPEPEPEDPPDTPEPEDDAKPKSAIQQELEKAVPGPGLPDVSTDIDAEDEDDLFK